MLKQIISRLSGMLTGGRWVWLHRLAFIVTLVAPVVLLVAVNYASLFREATEAAESKRLALAELSAAAVRGRIDGLVDLGVSFATRPLLVEAIARGNWAAALDVLDGVREKFPAIDRIILYDPAAVVRADSPHALPDVIGQSRADKPWYRRLRRTWTPCVSEVYPRGAEPRRNVVAIAVPVRINPASPVIGILQLQVKLEAFRDWLGTVDVGRGGIVYIVDQQGHLVYHPAFDTAKQLVDFSPVGIVAKVRAGRSGLEPNYNPVEKQQRLAAYVPVPPHGWGVIVTQPAAQAYAQRDRTLRRMLVLSAAVLAALFATVFFILTSLIASHRAEAATRHLAAIVESSDDAIMGGDLQGRILSWNAGAERIYGYTAAEAIGRKASMLYPPDTPENELRDTLAALARNESISRIETRRRRKDGATIDVSTTISPIHDKSGRIIGVSAISRDVTREKGLAIEREKLLRDLTHSLENVKTLKGLLPICAWCKKIRDDKGYWNQIETYVSEHTDADFSHGLCPDCAREHFAEYFKKAKG